MARTLYQVLGAHPRASEVELLAAWQRLADPLEREARISGSAAERLSELNAAWAVLGNPEARAAYDATLPDSVFTEPPTDEVLPDLDAAAGRPLLDWRVGRLLVLITVLSLLAIGWRSCSFSFSSDRARAQAEAMEAEARARDAETRARIDAQINGRDDGLPAGEARWQREQDERANEEARRESDAQIAAREAARRASVKRPKRLNFAHGPTPSARRLKKRQQSVPLKTAPAWSAKRPCWSVCRTTTTARCACIDAIHLNPISTPQARRTL